MEIYVIFNQKKLINDGVIIILPVMFTLERRFKDINKRIRNLSLILIKE